MEDLCWFVYLFVPCGLIDAYGMCYNSLTSFIYFDVKLCQICTLLTLLGWLLQVSVLLCLS